MRFVPFSEMTAEERAEAREIFRRQRIGFEMAEILQLRNLRSESQASLIGPLLVAFDAAAKLPPREGSGLVEYYRRLMRRGI